MTERIKLSCSKCSREYDVRLKVSKTEVEFVPCPTCARPMANVLFKPKVSATGRGGRRSIHDQRTVEMPDFTDLVESVTDIDESGAGVTRRPRPPTVEGLQESTSPLSPDAQWEVMMDGDLDES